MRVSLLDRDARTAALITYAIWYLVWLTYAASELIAGRTAFLAEAPADIVAVFAVATIAYGLYPLTQLTGGYKGYGRWALLFGAVFAAAFLQSLVNLAENLALGVVPSLDEAHHAAIRERFARNFRDHVYLCFANFATLAVLVELRRKNAVEVRAARAEAAVEHARLVALRLQLNPHFLFNALNALSSLVVLKRTEEAEEMLERLVDFLRASLAADPDEMVPLEDEAAAIDAYLAIEAVRFGDRMLVEMVLAPQTERAAVPSFILQPLVENAVKYGVARSRRPVTVRLQARGEDGWLILSVDDDGDDLPPVPAPAEKRGGMGVGLANVRARLAALYGGTASFEKDRIDGRYTVTLRLPLRILPD
ncbi:sensor histidine kinase [Sphingomonas jatrophae]|uniref:Histidine kinase-, DNA gyrase B-, and HSP90-like ATPase n=1 Tax=Sphingomonas jatrophae TaxID=1166337 RepID=A0A1I6JSA4_9SPHN|nr:histidine kinase [Sphingomonas jatrophae]SFR81832.1 Histidine kinase-, DNA gyrase B-, and HSP90-like ATPase [Sphingomonas jatrophae]